MLWAAGFVQCSALPPFGRFKPVTTKTRAISMPVSIMVSPAAKISRFCRKMHSKTSIRCGFRRPSTPGPLPVANFSRPARANVELKAVAKVSGAENFVVDLCRNLVESGIFRIRLRQSLRQRCKSGTFRNRLHCYRGHHTRTRTRKKTACPTVPRPCARA